MIKLFKSKKKYYSHEQSTTILLNDKLLSSNKITNCEYNKVFNIINKLNKYEYIKK